MGKLYVGNFGKLGEYFVPTTNFTDHQCTIEFDGSRFFKTDDALYVGLHVTKIDGLSEKSTCTFPCNMLFKLSTKPYEYEAFTGGQKVKSTIEPTPREKILYMYLTGEDPELNYLKNEGKGGMLMTGEYSNDADILDGQGNAKKHSRFVIEFDDDIAKFDMSGDTFSLDGIASGTVKAKSGGGGKPAETESQRIEARVKAIESLVKLHMPKLSFDDPNLMTASIKTLTKDPQFVVHACFVLGMPIPSGLAHYDF